MKECSGCMHEMMLDPEYVKAVMKGDGELIEKKLIILDGKCPPSESCPAREQLLKSGRA